MLNKKDISDWERIRKKLLEMENKNYVYVNGTYCRKCVWSDTDSGKILCSKKCRKKGGRI